MNTILLLLVQLLQAAGAPIALCGDQLVVGSTCKDPPALPPPPSGVDAEPIAISNGF